MSIHKSHRIQEIQFAQGWTDETLLDLCLEFINNGYSTEYDMSFENWLQEKANEENKQFNPVNPNEVEFIEVEYDTDYYGGDYSDVGQTAMIPADLAERIGMGMAFRQTTGFDPIHIIHYSPDKRYNKDGDLVS